MEGMANYYCSVIMMREELREGGSVSEREGVIDERSTDDHSAKFDACDRDVRT